MKPSVRVEGRSLSWVLRAAFRGLGWEEEAGEGSASWLSLVPLPPLNPVVELAGLRGALPPARHSPGRPPSHAGVSGGW